MFEVIHACNSQENRMQLRSFILETIVYPLALLENIEVSSLLAQSSLPKNAIYKATRFFLIAISQSVVFIASEKKNIMISKLSDELSYR